MRPVCGVPRGPPVVPKNDVLLLPPEMPRPPERCRFRNEKRHFAISAIVHLAWFAAMMARKPLPARCTSSALRLSPRCLPPLLACTLALTASHRRKHAGVPRRRRPPAARVLVPAAHPPGGPLRHLLDVRPPRRHVEAEGPAFFPAQAPPACALRFGVCGRPPMRFAGGAAVSHNMAAGRSGAADRSSAALSVHPPQVAYSRKICHTCLFFMPIILLKAWPFPIRKDDAWILPLWTSWCGGVRGPHATRRRQNWGDAHRGSVRRDACVRSRGPPDRTAKAPPRRLSFLPFYFLIKPVRRVLTIAMICFRCERGGDAAQKKWAGQPAHLRRGALPHRGPRLFRPAGLWTARTTGRTRSSGSSRRRGSGAPARAALPREGPWTGPRHPLPPTPPRSPRRGSLCLSGSSSSSCTGSGACGPCWCVRLPAPRRAAPAGGALWMRPACRIPPAQPRAPLQVAIPLIINGLGDGLAEPVGYRRDTPNPSRACTSGGRSTPA